MSSSTPRYNSYGAYLRSTFGFRVHKVTLDAGFTCPNRDGTVGSGGCLYCNTKGSGTGAHVQGLSVSEQLRTGIARLSRRYKARGCIAYFQAFSNTYAGIDTLRALYEEALAVDGVVGLAIGTRPDCVDEQVLDYLASLAKRTLVWVEYGVQSMRDDTLEAIRRGHTAAVSARRITDTRRRGIPVCAHVIFGLPGEGRADMLDTVSRLAHLGIDGIKFHLLYVTEGTGLAGLFHDGSYRCMERCEYVETVGEALALLPKHTVVQRLTSDPHRHELVAPEWSLDKQGVLSDIERLLEERDIRQGDRFGSASAV